MDGLRLNARLRKVPDAYLYVADISLSVLILSPRILNKGSTKLEPAKKKSTGPIHPFSRVLSASQRKGFVAQTEEAHIPPRRVRLSRTPALRRTRILISEPCPASADLFSPVSTQRYSTPSAGKPSDSIQGSRKPVQLSGTMMRLTGLFAFLTGGKG